MASTLVWLSNDGKICALKWCVYKTPSCKSGHILILNINKFMVHTKGRLVRIPLTLVGVLVAASVSYKRRIAIPWKVTTIYSTHYGLFCSSICRWSDNYRHKNLRFHTIDSFIYAKLYSIFLDAGNICI